MTQATAVRLPAAVAPPDHRRLERFEDFFLREYRPAVSVAAVVVADRGLAEAVATDSLFGVRHRFEASSDLVLRTRGLVVRRAAQLEGPLRAIVRARLTRVGAVSRIGPPIASDVWVWQVVRGLPVTHRAAVALHHLDDMPASQIGQVLGCPERVAAAHLGEALDALAIAEDVR